MQGVPTRVGDLGGYLRILPSTGVGLQLTWKWPGAEATIFPHILREGMGESCYMLPGVDYNTTFLRARGVCDLQVCTGLLSGSLSVL